MVLDPNRTGKIVNARVVTRGDEVTLISSTGIILRTSVDTISRQSRSTQGVRVMDLREDDMVASVAVVREGRLSRVTGEEEVISANGEGVDTI
jgi:DNA gyrase subunit A